MRFLLALALACTSFSAVACSGSQEMAEADDEAELGEEQLEGAALGVGAGEVVGAERAGQGAHAMTDISLGLAAGQNARQPRIFWKICAAYFEAVAKGLLPDELYVKRAASRILMQYATLAKGDTGVSDRLAQARRRTGTPTAAESAGSAATNGTRRVAAADPLAEDRVFHSEDLRDRSGRSTG